MEIVQNPVDVSPVRTVTVYPDTIIDSVGNEYVSYKWQGAEIAEIIPLSEEIRIPNNFFFGYGKLWK